MRYSDLQIVGADTSGVALVLGGSGTLGSAICRKLAQSGWDVALQYRTSSERARSVAGVVDGYGRRALPLACDLRSSQALRHLVSEVRRKLGSPTAVIHAATPPIESVAWRSSAKSFHAFTTIYVSALVTVVDACIEEMLYRQRGVVLGLLTEALMVPPVFGWSAYEAAKFAMMAYLRSLAQRMSDSGVRVLGLAPGAVQGSGGPEAGNRDARTRRDIRRHWPVGIAASTVADLVLEMLQESAAFPNGTLASLDMTRGRRMGNVLHAMDGLWGERGGAISSPSESTGGRGAVSDPPRPSAENAKVAERLKEIFRKSFGLQDDRGIEDMALDVSRAWDSLKQIQLMLELEAAFSVEFLPEDIPQLLTFRDIARVIGGKAAVR